jgi:hypothetical protein
MTNTHSAKKRAIEKWRRTLAGWKFVRQALSEQFTGRLSKKKEDKSVLNFAGWGVGD